MRVFLLDGHNEFARCFGARANVVHPLNLKLPFWLFNFEEFIDVVYGGRPAVEEELEILAEHIPVAKGMYLAHRASQSDRFGLRKIDPKRAGFTVDTPVPYLLADLVNLIDERMGKLENRATRMHCHRLIARLEALQQRPALRLHVRERQCRRRHDGGDPHPPVPAWSRTASRSR